MTTKFLAAACAGLAMAGCQPAAPKVQTANLYERTAQLARDPVVEAKLKSAAARLDQMRWLIGAWRAEVTVFRTPTTPEERSVETTTFSRRGDSLIADERLSTIIGFDPFRGRWLAAGFELPATPGLLAYGDWDGRRMVVVADTQILGETYRLRQTMTRLGDDQFELFNEQWVGGDRWVPVDRYRYTRLPAGA